MTLSTDTPKNNPINPPVVAKKSNDKCDKSEEELILINKEHEKSDIFNKISS